jgi:hypothetical protein
MGFSTDQCLFCIRKRQVQIQDGTSDFSIKSFCVFLSFSRQIPRYFMLRALNNCVTFYQSIPAFTWTSVHVRIPENHDDAAHCPWTGEFFSYFYTTFRKLTLLPLSGCFLYQVFFIVFFVTESNSILFFF